MNTGFFSKTISKIRTYGALVMFSHSLFSLPFALIAMFLAADGLPEPRIFAWIIVALFAGRNGANSLNRYVDAKIDAKNPRTANRHIPAGQVRRIDALLIALICFVLFVVAAAQINSLCLYLSPVALVLFCLYSFTKRFTWFCHIVLGITCAGAPLGAWIAVRGNINDCVPVLFSIAVMLWIAGFDIIYGTQDIDFDRKEGLFSMPARFGLKNSLRIAAVFHTIMCLLLLSFFFTTQLSWIYLAGVIISAALLIVEHLLVSPSHRRKMNIASYNINQIIGMLLLFVTILDMIFLW